MNLKIVFYTIYFINLFFRIRCNRLLYSAVFFVCDPNDNLVEDWNKKRFEIFISDFTHRYKNITVDGIFDFLSGKDSTPNLYYDTDFLDKLNKNDNIVNAYTNDLWDSLPMKNHSHCPMFEERLKEYKSDDKYVKNMKKYHDIMVYVSFSTKENIHDLEELAKVYTTLHKEILRNDAVAQKFYTVDMQEFRDAACYGMSILSDTTELARLSVGPIIKSVMNRLVHIYNATSFVTQDLYRLDRSTLVLLLNALNVYNDDCPEDYGAMYLEVYESNDGNNNIPMVRLSYRSDMLGDKERPLNISDCGVNCPLENFTRLYKEIQIPIDAKYCSVEPKKPHSRSYAGYIVFALVGLLALLGPYVFLYICAFKSQTLNKQQNVSISLTDFDIEDYVVRYENGSPTVIFEK